MRSTLLLWKWLAISLAFAALATPSIASAQSVEITPFIGYRFGGDFETDSSFFLDTFDVEVEESASFGAMLDFSVTRNFQIELLFSRQESELVEGRGGGLFEPNTDFILFDIDVDYYHIGTLWQWTPGQVRPYVVFSLGATRLSPDAAGLDDETKFSTSFGTGLKLMFSRNVGIRLDARLFTTFIDEDDDDFCFDDDDDFCYRYDDSDYLVQGEVSGGLVLAF